MCGRHPHRRDFGSTCTPKALAERGSSRLLRNVSARPYRIVVLWYRHLGVERRSHRPASIYTFTCNGAASLATHYQYDVVGTPMSTAERSLINSSTWPSCDRTNVGSDLLHDSRKTIQCVNSAQTFVLVLQLRAGFLERLFRQHQ